MNNLCNPIWLTIAESEYINSLNRNLYGYELVDVSKPAKHL